MTTEIDDSFYSRQRYVLGDDAMMSLSQASVYVCGLGGVGIEIAKNLVLAGVKQLILDDPTQCSIYDCATQFYIKPSHVSDGLSRAEASAPELAALNPYVNVKITRTILTTWKPWEGSQSCAVAPFLDSDDVNCLVLTNCHLYLAATLDMYCHHNNIKFIYANALGVMGNVFCDFGPKFTVFDATGEPLQEFFIENITKAERALLTAKGQKYRYLEDGTQLQFEEISGMTEMNGLKAHVKNRGDEGLELDIDTRAFGDFTGNGIAREIKTPNAYAFQTMAQQLKSPSIVEVDLTRDQVAMQAHIAFVSLMSYSYGKQRLPRAWSEKDATEVIEIAKCLKFSTPSLNEELLAKISKTSRGQVAPLCSVIGGIAAQEVIKAVTQKFTPLKQWMYFLVDDILPESYDSSRLLLQGSRYDPLVFCIGTHNMEKLTHTSGFMVGCGAIGCELLKNLALMGMATGRTSKHKMSGKTRPTRQQNNSGGNAISSSGFPFDDVFLFSGSIDRLAESLEIFGERFIPPSELAAIERNSNLLEPALSSRSGRVSPGFGDTATLDHPLHGFRVETRVPDAAAAAVATTAGAMVMLHPFAFMDQLGLFSGPGSVTGTRGEGETSSPSEYDTYEDGGSSTAEEISGAQSLLRCDSDQNPEVGATFTNITNTNSLMTPESAASDSFDSTQGKELNCQKEEHADASKRERFPSEVGNKKQVLFCGEQEMTISLGSLHQALPLTWTSPLPPSSNNSCQHSHPPACLTITDMDHIEKSNLNRQFLFRPEHVGLAKSAVAAESIRRINPHMRIRALQSMLSNETETTVFTDEFLCNSAGRCAFCEKQPTNIRDSNSGVVLAALDNILARNYLDRRCVANHLPMFESGTQGTKGNVQTILPNLTESYSSQHKGITDGDAEAAIPYCTLKSFPSRPTDCVEWAREKFYSQFSLKAQSLGRILAAFKGHPDRLKRVFKYFSSLGGITQDLPEELELDTQQRAHLKQLNHGVLAFFETRPHTWHDCLRTARGKFEKYFKHKALHLLHKFPDDATEQDGKPFWQLPRRKPSPIEFDIFCPVHKEFVLSFAHLLAQQLEIEPLSSRTYSELDEEDLRDALSDYTPPIFTPSQKDVITDPSVGRNRLEAGAGGHKDWPALFARILQRLDSMGLDNWNCHSIEFNKDNLQSGHMEFMHSTTNLRASMYAIPITSRTEVKRIAGRIIPAIATTTAAVAGLVCLEVLKYICRPPPPPSSSSHLVRKGDDLLARNHFLNLALPTVFSIFPSKCSQQKLPNGMSYNLWDRWSIQLPSSAFTLAEFIHAVKEKYSLDISLISHHDRVLFVKGWPQYMRRINLPFLDTIKSSHKESYLDLIVAYQNDNTGKSNSNAEEEEDEIVGPPFRVFLPESQSSPPASASSMSEAS